MNDLLETRIRQVIADVLGLSAEAVDDDASPDTIVAWDSVKHLSLVLALEQELDVEFDPDEVETMTSVGAIVDAVDRKVSRA